MTYDDEQATGKGVVRVAVVAALGGFLFGYDSAVINGAVFAVSKRFGGDRVLLGFAVGSALLAAAAADSSGDVRAAAHITQRHPSCFAGSNKGGRCAGFVTSTAPKPLAQPLNDLGRPGPPRRMCRTATHQLRSVLPSMALPISYAAWMPAETNHVTGQEGVRLVKRFLESTTRVVLPHTVYDNEALCTLQRLDGKVKRYDLVGHFVTGLHRPLSVESKKVTGVGSQSTEYREFLANAYSVTKRQLQIADDLREFMWATWHPFDQTKWVRLRSRTEIGEALAAHPEVLGGEDVEEGVVELVAERLWLVPLHDRLEELLLEPEEVYPVLRALERRM